MIWRCDLVPQYIALKSEIQAAMERVLCSGRYILACELEAFEREFAAYTGVAHAVGVGNGTDALTLALQTAGVEPGDEVITTPFTAIPTVSSIVDAGARPVFVDIHPDTLLMNIDAVPAAVTSRTRAVMPVHIFGNPVDIPRLRTLLPDRIAIIEDAAQAHGSSIHGMKCGSMGDLAAFSFYPTKNLGGYGDGGAVVTGRADYARTLRLRRMYGMVDKDHIECHGINTRLDELQAAVLRCKLNYLDSQNEMRRRIARRYTQELRSDRMVTQAVSEGADVNYHVYVAKVRGDRDGLVEYLDGQGIQTNVYYPLPLYRQKAFGDEYSGLRLPVVEQVCGEVIALPMYPELDEDTVTRVISAINAY